MRYRCRQYYYCKYVYMQYDSYFNYVIASRFYITGTSLLSIYLCAGEFNDIIEKYVFNVHKGQLYQPYDVQGVKTITITVLYKCLLQPHVTNATNISFPNM